MSIFFVYVENGLDKIIDFLRTYVYPGFPSCIPLCRSPRFLFQHDLVPPWSFRTCSRSCGSMTHGQAFGKSRYDYICISSCVSVCLLDSFVIPPIVFARALLLSRSVFHSHHTGLWSFISCRWLSSILFDFVCVHLRLPSLVTALSLFLFLSTSIFVNALDMDWWKCRCEDNLNLSLRYI